MTRMRMTKGSRDGGLGGMKNEEEIGKSRDAEENGQSGRRSKGRRWCHVCRYMNRKGLMRRRQGAMRDERSEGGQKGGHQGDMREARAK